MIANGGYGNWKYNQTGLERKVRLLKHAIPTIMRLQECDGVVLHGSSGVWLGAVLVLHGILPEGAGLFLVRKPGENSHGEMVEGDGKSECNRLLMIDDFICTGTSVHRVQMLITDNKIRPAYVAAVLQHERMVEGDSYESPIINNHTEGKYYIY